MSLVSNSDGSGMLPSIFVGSKSGYLFSMRTMIWSKTTR